MGEDKSQLPFGNVDTLIQYQYDRLSQLFKTVYISSKIDKFNFKSKLILDNNIEVSSPMIALQAILKKIDSKVFIITVDTPFIKKETIYKLIEASQNNEITIAKDSNKVHNLCGVFSKVLLTKVDRCLKKDIHKINYLIKDSDTTYISFNDNKEFLNINTTIDYIEATSIISSANNLH